MKLPCSLLNRYLYQIKVLYFWTKAQWNEVNLINLYIKRAGAYCLLGGKKYANRPKTKSLKHYSDKVLVIRLT